MDFDPAVISYEQLLDVFWENHDPFSGSFSRQYAAILFFHDTDQEKAARESVASQERDKGGKVLTDIVPYREFFMAEDYHQKYYLKGNSLIYNEFRTMYPDGNDLVSSTAAARVNGYLGGNGNPEQIRDELPLLGLSPDVQRRLKNLFPSIDSPD